MKTKKKETLESPLTRALRLKLQELERFIRFRTYVESALAARRAAARVRHETGQPARESQAVCQLERSEFRHLPTIHLPQGS
jgi:hypothetical protein